MQLLSYLGQLSSRKDKLIQRARDLYYGHKSIESMEQEMAERTSALVARLRDDKIRFSEFQRVAADENITAQTAAYMLGLKSDKLTQTQYAETTKSLVYLWKFFAAIEKALEVGRIQYGDTDYAEVIDIEELLESYEGDYTDEELQEWLDRYSDRELGGGAGASTPATWNGVQSRLAAYFVLPIYGFSAAGEYARMRQGGATQMRRVARRDKKTCEDCNRYDSQGWVPIGLLPPPGQGCRCHVNCRCEIVYQ